MGAAGGVGTAHGSGGAAASGRAAHAGHRPRGVAHADCSTALQTGCSNWGLAGCSTERLAAHSSQGPLAAHPTCPHGCCSRADNGEVHLGGVGTGAAQGAARQSTDMSTRSEVTDLTPGPNHTSVHSHIKLLLALNSVLFSPSPNRYQIPIGTQGRCISCHDSEYPSMLDYEPYTTQNIA